MYVAGGRSFFAVPGGSETQNCRRASPCSLSTCVDRCEDGDKVSLHGALCCVECGRLYARRVRSGVCVCGVDIIKLDKPYILLLCGVYNGTNDSGLSINKSIFIQKKTSHS